MGTRSSLSRQLLPCIPSLIPKEALNLENIIELLKETLQKSYMLPNISQLSRERKIYKNGDYHLGLLSF
jgi:hypothetical protein